jgi:hypothetical protein
VAIRIDGVRGAAIAGFAVAAGVVLPWYLIELQKVGIRVRALGARVWLPLLSGAGVGLFALGLTGWLRSNLTVLLVGGVVALATIGLLIYRQLPDLATVRSVFSNAEEPVAVATAAGQQAAEQAAGPMRQRMNGREAEPVGAAPAHEWAANRATEPFRPLVNTPVTEADPAPPSWGIDDTPAPLSWGIDDTVVFPALRAQQLYSAVIDESAGAADVTAPLPIFRDPFAPGVS